MRGSQSISTRRAAALGRGFTPHITALRRAGWHVGDERRGEAAPWWPSCCQASASASAGLCALVRQVEPRPGGGLRRGLRGVADDRACRGQARDARRGWSYPSTTREAIKVKVHTFLHFLHKRWATSSKVSLPLNNSEGTAASADQTSDAHTFHKVLACTASAGISWMSRYSRLPA